MTDKRGPFILGGFLVSWLLLGILSDGCTGVMSLDTEDKIIDIFRIICGVFIAGVILFFIHHWVTEDVNRPNRVSTYNPEKEEIERLEEKHKQEKENLQNEINKLNKIDKLKTDIVKEYIVDMREDEDTNKEDSKVEDNKQIPKATKVDKKINAPEEKSLQRSFDDYLDETKELKK
tara:strand:+ start:141 stop:668 length:528 start_codon:yes stop_codon:yes gene_type:complete